MAVGEDIVQGAEMTIKVDPSHEVEPLLLAAEGRNTIQKVRRKCELDSSDEDETSPSTTGAWDTEGWTEGWKNVTKVIRKCELDSSDEGEEVEAQASIGKRILPVQVPLHASAPTARLSDTSPTAVSAAFQKAKREITVPSAQGVSAEAAQPSPSIAFPDQSTHTANQATQNISRRLLSPPCPETRGHNRDGIHGKTLKRKSESPHLGRQQYRQYRKQPNGLHIDSEDRYDFKQRTKQGGNNRYPSQPSMKDISQSQHQSQEESAPGSKVNIPPTLSLGHIPAINYEHVLKRQNLRHHH